MAKGEKRSFVLYYDYRKHLALLTDAERGKLLMSLLDYAEHGTTPELDGAVLMAFSFIAGQMDRDTEKYEETCRKRREAGKQGGRPLKDAEQTEANGFSEKQTKAKKANGFFEKQTKAKKPDNDTDTDNDTDNDNDNDIIIPPISPKVETDADAKPDAQERRFDEFWDLYPKKVGKKAAQSSWKRIHPDAALFDRIIQSVTAAKRSEQWIRENGRFIPNPATWLNQGRWDDELTASGQSYPQAAVGYGGKFNTMDVLAEIIAEEEGGGFF